MCDFLNNKVKDHVTLATEPCVLEVILPENPRVCVGRQSVCQESAKKIERNLHTAATFLQNSTTVRFIPGAPFV